MNRHEDDDGHSTGQSSQSSRIGARVFSHNIVIYIEALTGQLYELRCSPLESIWNVKGRLARLEGIPISQQHMIWSGEELKDSAILHEVGIRNLSKLRLVVSMRGGPVNTRVVEDDIDESESEIALVVVKDGEKISLVRFLPSSSVTPSGGASVTAAPSKVENDSKFGVKLCDRQRTLDNKQTLQKMEMIRSRLNQRKKNNAQLPPLIHRMKSIKEPAREAINTAGMGSTHVSSFPAIEPSDSYKIPVPNVHSTFLKRYGLQPPRNQISTTFSPSPPTTLAPVKSLRPRCAKCGKRLALTEQYECRCGLKYCSRHRYAEEHSCQFDYQKEQQAKLRAGNPSLERSKLPKI